MKTKFFQRIILPGFAFKAVVIGGGYATGRELVEFFLASGPIGGLLGLLVTTVVWSAVCATTFLFAHVTASYDYRTFFQQLLGPGWLVFELAYVCLMLLVLSVFGAAAGEIFATAFGMPAVIGMFALAGGIIGFATFGRVSVEALFKYVSFFLYAIYGLFFLLAVTKFGGRIEHAFVTSPPAEKWLRGGLTYAGYNLVGAIIVLPVTRHFTSRSDAVVAGLLSGVLAALPAILFFIAIVGFYPDIGAAALPSDYVLSRINQPVFHIAFQIMVLLALLESGTGLVHALNERFARGEAGLRFRVMTSAAIVVVAMFVATKVGLISLIANGYRVSAYVFIAIYAVPLFTIGALRIARASRPPLPNPAGIEHLRDHEEA